MSRNYVWGPILDGALMSLDELRRMNRKSDFYPYDVKVIMDEKTNKPSEYYIEVALAGINKDELNVQLTNDGGLSIEVNPERKARENERLLRNQISYAKKSIVFDLVKECDVKGIESKFNNGLLSIKIPMIVEKSKARQIKIG